MIEQPKTSNASTPEGAAVQHTPEPSIHERVNRYSDALRAAFEIPVHLKTDLTYDLEGNYSPNISSVDEKMRTLNLLEMTYSDRVRNLATAMTEYQKCATQEGFNHLDYMMAAPGNIAVTNLSMTTSYLVNLLDNLATVQHPESEIIRATLGVFELWQRQCQVLADNNLWAEQEAQEVHDALVYSSEREQDSVEESDDDDGYSGPQEDDDRDSEPLEEQEEDVANWGGASFRTWT